MGAVGYWWSERSVFVLAAVLALPALWALRLIRASDAAPPKPVTRQRAGLAMLDRRLLIFALCCGGFHLANAALFPIAAVQVTRQIGSKGQLVIAACLIVPQVLVALLSPAVGRLAESWGRRPVLLIGFAAVPLRAVLFALSDRTGLTVAFQALDGVSGAVFGVMLPLVVADITRGTGRFNLCMGAVGLFIGGGAALGTAVGGGIAGHYGNRDAFLAMAAAGLVTCAALWALLPETKGATAA